jgi:nicotinamidase-related amidase
MPSLVELVDGSACALVTVEVQEGVVGKHSGLPYVAEAAREGPLANMQRLVKAARIKGVPVIHCLMQPRADGVGANQNCWMFRAASSMSTNMTQGGTGSPLVSELGPEPGDIISSRSTGIGPMGGTELESVLRNLGVKTVVGIGVSVNIAILNLVMDSVNRGFWFVLPRDAVAGFPQEYAEAVVDHSLRLLATITTTDEVLAAWRN